MARTHRYHVYLMASFTRVLYVGVTNDLERRVYQHKTKQLAGFTARYNVTRLVYYETTDSVRAAIEREKQIKSWSRGKKVALIESVNPDWFDLAERWPGGGGPT
jgi:putative endonuclease